jgi:hypothetical protein
MADCVTRTLVLVRPCQGVCGEAERVVHLIPLAVGAEVSGVVQALCEVSLAADQVEAVAPGVGMPCDQCLLHRGSAESRPAPSAKAYREWGWPVIVREDQVLLTLGFEAVALVLPDGLAEAVTAILAGRDRPAPVLMNPGTSQEWVLLAGEPFGVPLPWPDRARLLTGTLPLPPSITPHGPIRWQHPPTTPDLAGCREIDVFSAVRTMLKAAAHMQDGAA